MQTHEGTCSEQALRGGGCGLETEDGVGIGGGAG